MVPLVLLSGAWTTSLTLTSTATADAPHGGDGKLPDGTTVPDQAIKAPASVGQPGQIAPGVPEGSADKVSPARPPTASPPRRSRRTSARRR